VFILGQNAFGDARLHNIQEFVKYWSQFDQRVVRDDATHGPISYLDELHLGGGLTTENIRKLLRWKDPQHLTHVTKGGESNPKVQKVLANIAVINSFRRQEIPYSDFFDVVSEIFRSNGAVYRAFLFHIARPTDYPIWDQNVARVHALLTRRKNDRGWKHYTDYLQWFTRLKTLLAIGHDSTRENVQKAKCFDSALLAYGQFLKRYGSNVDARRDGVRRQRAHRKAGHD
jgi:hypothetical protein